MSDPWIVITANAISTLNWGVHKLIFQKSRSVHLLLFTSVSPMY